MSSTGAKGSQQTNTKSKERVQNKGAKYIEGTPGLAHRTVRCASGATATSRQRSSATSIKCAPARAEVRAVPEGAPDSL
jgi:hypothetical protein